MDSNHCTSRRTMRPRSLDDRSINRLEIFREPVFRHNLNLLNAERRGKSFTYYEDFQKELEPHRPIKVYEIIVLCPFWLAHVIGLVLNDPLIRFTTV